MTWESVLLGLPKSIELDASTLWALVREDLHRRMERRGTPRHRARTVRRDDDVANVVNPRLELARDGRTVVHAGEVAWFRFEGDLATLLHEDELWALPRLVLDSARPPWLLVWALQNGASVDSYAPATKLDPRAALPTMEERLWLLVAEAKRSEGRPR